MYIFICLVCLMLIALSGAKLLVDNASADELSKMGVERKS